MAECVDAGVEANERDTRNEKWENRDSKLSDSVAHGEGAQYLD